MSNSAECVELVKKMTAELFREQRELVERLNAMHAGIEQENHLASKALRKVQWIEERDRTVRHLNKVLPLRYSFPPACDHEDPAAAGVGHAVPTTYPLHLRR
jgi:hypothetical protein